MKYREQAAVLNIERIGKDIFSLVLQTKQIAKEAAKAEKKGQPYTPPVNPETFKDFLEKWVYQYLKYPQEAVRDGIQGRVLVDFVIDESGKVTRAKVIKGVDPLLDEEALKVINASPPWRPGYVKGKKVKAEISLYVEFRLEKKHKK